MLCVLGFYLSSSRHQGHVKPSQPWKHDLQNFLLLGRNCKWDEGSNELHHHFTLKDEPHLTVRARTFMSFLFMFEISGEHQVGEVEVVLVLKLAIQIQFVIKLAIQIQLITYFGVETKMYGCVSYLDESCVKALEGFWTCQR